MYAEANDPKIPEGQAQHETRDLMLHPAVWQHSHDPQDKKERRHAYGEMEWFRG
jgi:hypothetical protein